MSTSAPAAPSTPAVPSQEDQALSLFARSTLDLFHIWPALRLAITHGWGGSSGSQARTHLAEDIVDLFYSTATETASTENTRGTTSMSQGGVPVPARDEVEATLKWGIGQQFDLDLEDGSEEVIAKDLLLLWRECIQLVQEGKLEEEGVLAKKFREGAEKAKREDGSQRFEASRAPGAEDEDTTDEEDSEGFETEEEDTEMGEAAPPREPRERLEPIVDEDGFEMVQPKKKGGKR
ncbi:hypothetical protein JCM5353_004031 [Sporobolomyces roseus]